MKVKFEIDTENEMGTQSFIQLTEKLLDMVTKLCDKKESNTRGNNETCNQET